MSGTDSVVAPLLTVCSQAGGTVSFSSSSGTLGVVDGGVVPRNSNGTANATMMTTTTTTELGNLVSGGALLNFSEVARRTASLDALTGVAPRWLALSRVARPDNSSINSTAIVLVIDFDRERDIGLGRAFSHRKLLPHETHLSSVALRRLGVKPTAGENVTMIIDVLGFASQTLGLNAGTSGASSTGSVLQSLLERALSGGSNDADGNALNATALFAQFGNFSLADAVARINNATGQSFTIDALARYIYGAFNSTPPTGVDYTRPLLSIFFDAVADASIVRRNLTVVDAIETPVK